MRQQYSLFKYLQGITTKREMILPQNIATGLKLISIIMAVIIITFQGSYAQENKTYKLVWQDEFDTDGKPNENNWCNESGFVRNFETQWYQQQNAYCKDGNLIIEAKREKKPNPNFISLDDESWRKNRDTIKITSSCLITRGKQQWKFGRFEMRAKIPVDMGAWPAFWTLGISQNWPASGEIDIMEYYRGMILANAAWESTEKWKPLWDDLKLNISHFGEDWAEQFHIWRMDWDEEFIRIYVDDELLNEVDLAKTYNGTNPTFNPFHQPHYLLVNLAIGGANGGDPTYAKFPIFYVIDYIRVYQK